MDRVADTFKPGPPALVWKGGAVACGPDAGIGGAAEFVGADAVVDFKARLLGQQRQWRDADADNDEIDCNFAAVREHRAGDAAIAGQPVDTGIFKNRHAVISMQLTEIVRGFGRGHPLQDARRHFDQGDLKPQLRAHCRRFQADIATANDEEPAVLNKLRSHFVDIGKRAHGIDTDQIAADRRRQAARPRAGGQRELVVRCALAACTHGFRSAVDCSDPRASLQGDLLVLPERGSAKIEPFKCHLAKKIAFRERRTLVGWHRLLADHRDTVLIAKRPQLRRE